MKKKLSSLLTKLEQSGETTVKGGFASLRGGTASIESQNIKCTNDFVCSGFNKDGCTNNNNCTGTTNQGGDCSNFDCLA
jgi:hypothetical protein